MNELEITRIGAQGDGVAATEHGTVFVPYVLPGERVRVRLAGDRGTLIEVLRPSPARVCPVCRHFTRCGGCALQHLGLEASRAWKQAQIGEALRSRKIADDVVRPIIGVGLAERRRAVLACARAPRHPAATEGTTAGRIALGFHAEREHQIVNIEECPVLAGAITRALPGLRRLIEPLLPAIREVRVGVLSTETGLDVALEGVSKSLDARTRAALASHAADLRLGRMSLDGETVYASTEPKVRCGPAEVVPPPGAFLQASAAAQDVMSRLILEALPPRPRRVADLFAGIGTFTFPLATRASVVAIDSAAASLAALDAARRRTQGVKPIEARVRDLTSEPLSPRELEAFDAVLLDPPRAGAAAQCDRLARSKVGRVIVVSCNPATLARDLRTLIDGGYALQSLTPIDQFVFSSHIEAVAVLKR